MTPTSDSIISGLQNLTADDFDDTKEGFNGIARLDDLCDQVAEIEDPETVFPAFFEVMERLPDVDLGCPGAMVHTMENYDGKYESYLEESLKRKPTELSILMANRILNSPTNEKEKWMNLLVLASKHEKATEFARSEASRYIKYQESK